MSDSESGSDSGEKVKNSKESESSEDEQQPTRSERSTTTSTEPKKGAQDSDDEAEDADDLLEDEHRADELLKSKKTAQLQENQRDKDLKRLKSVRSLERKHVMKNKKLKQERIKNGNLSIPEIQNLIRAQKEDQETDWIAEIQELKRNLVSEVRKNHVLERDLSKLDKRIALLIKNRGNIQEVMLHHGNKPKKSQSQDTRTDFVSDQRKLEHYQNLFYLIQTEPKYLANLVYLMQPEQMEQFLDTVILTLYGDAFSPREEYLILRLFSLAIQKEMSAITKVSDFLKADSVVPKMVITYNRRKQGLEFLKAALGPILKTFIGRGADINLELNPTVIYAQMISEQEIRTGEKSTLDRNLNADQIMELKEVKDIVNERVKNLEEVCQQFYDGIITSMNKLPYGIRYICKQIANIAEENFQSPNKDDILKVIGYFIYYRFVNLAIVTPDAFEIIDKELNPIARKNLVSISKVLQNLFNLSVFGKSDRWFVPLNAWINKRSDSVREYFSDIIAVADPEDYLQVDKYMELTQKTKPVIIISLQEISQTHKLLVQTIEKLTKEKEDPLRLILNDLGEVPSVSDQDDREIQLTLTNRFKQNVEDDLGSANSLYLETKEHIITTFKSIPVSNSGEEDQTLLGILQHGKSYAVEKKDDQLEKQIDSILKNLIELEKLGLVSKGDNYAGFLRDVALEVANRAEVREQQKKEIKRLNQTLRNLRKHQKYLNDQIQQYKDYLEDCRRKHYQPKNKKKKKKKNVDNPNKIGPFKFSYSALVKKGVIISAEVPSIGLKFLTFEISSESVGVFDIVAKVKGAEVEKMTLELDDLLERNYNNITRLELEQVTLDVNMTIYLINKFFLK